MGTHKIHEKRRGEQKRFWKEVTVVQEGEEGAEQRFSIALDRRVIRLPKGTRLSVTSHALAEALAEEWRLIGEGQNFVPTDLPLTGMTGFMVECLPQAQKNIIQNLLAYAQSDLLSYREASYSALYRRQSEIWDPLLQQLEVLLGCRLAVTTGVMPMTQTEETMRIFQQALEASTQVELTVLGNVVPVMGSLALGFLLLKTHMTAETLVQAATLDEQFQMTLWGTEPEITQRIATMTKDIATAIRFLTLCQKG
ncbi:MAG: hypothetical protein IJ934_06025 [Acetobacter sp.]|nr:hypothetical protein [Acetobacter sp.]